MSPWRGFFLLSRRWLACLPQFGGAFKCDRVSGGVGFWQVAFVAVVVF